MNCARSIAVQPSPVARSVMTRGFRTQVGRRAADAADAAAATVEPGGAADATATQRLRKIESMPFQTYQLAMDYIKKDREEKDRLISLQRWRIDKALKKTGMTSEHRKIKSQVRHLEYLKIQADINNPKVKYNLDQGITGVNRPVYRFLMNRKWREYRRPVLMQRLTQMNVVPDVLPKIDPVVEVQVRFRGKGIQPGAVVDSLQTERPPTFKVIPFTRDKKLCTVVVVDPDVPIVEKDTFNYRLHWLVSNIAITQTETQAVGTGAKESDTIVDWLPPHVQKGAPYHRYAMFVFQQPGPIDASALQGTIRRDGFRLRSFQDKQKLSPIGAFMWRGEWDAHTKEVMQRHGLEGWDKMLVRRKD